MKTVAHYPTPWKVDEVNHQKPGFDTETTFRVIDADGDVVASGIKCRDAADQIAKASKALAREESKP